MYQMDRCTGMVYDDDRKKKRVVDDKNGRENQSFANGPGQASHVPPAQPRSPASEREMHRCDIRKQSGSEQPRV